MSGVAAISFASRSRSSASSFDVSGRLRGGSSSEPVSRRRWISRRTHAWQQPKVSAVSI